MNELAWNALLRSLALVNLCAWWIDFKLWTLAVHKLQFGLMSKKCAFAVQFSSSDVLMIAFTENIKEFAKWFQCWGTYCVWGYCLGLCFWHAWLYNTSKASDTSVCLCACRCVVGDWSRARFYGVTFGPWPSAYKHIQMPNILSTQTHSHTLTEEVL